MEIFLWPIRSIGRYWKNFKASAVMYVRTGIFLWVTPAGGGVLIAIAHPIVFFISAIFSAILTTGTSVLVQALISVGVWVSVGLVWRVYWKIYKMGVPYGFTDVVMASGLGAILGVLIPWKYLLLLFILGLKTIGG